MVIDCLRLDQWRFIEPLLTPMFDIETTHYFSVLPTATPYSRNALFSGLFPGEIAARFPDWWGEREDESLNAHERAAARSAARRDRLDGSGALREGVDGRRGRRHRAPAGARDRARGHLGVRVQLRRPAHARTVGVGDPVRGGARRNRAAPAHAPVVPALGAVRRAAGGGAPQGEGARDERPRLDPLPHAGHGVRQARRDAESALQVRRGSSRRESGAGACCSRRRIR